MTRLKITLLCCLLTALLSACGLKGPLYLPGESAPPSTAGQESTEQGAEDDQEQDGEKKRGTHS
ncbi:MAG: lipoprotein [Xanthomonadales bacterium]|nr:lipoprotein [Xanthomonadales bacterium]